MKNKLFIAVVVVLVAAVVLVLLTRQSKQEVVKEEITQGAEVESQTTSASETKIPDEFDDYLDPAFAELELIDE